ncbi:MAG: phosphatidylserine decarboxylase [Sulfurimonadaceae bacterium]
MRHLTSLFSQGFGKFANTHFPKPIQDLVNKGYVNLMGLDMSEFRDPTTYTSLNALFTRNLEIPREFSEDPKDFISPCDSLITECGRLHEDIALHIKGMYYNINDLLGDMIDDVNKEKLIDGDFINFYLSPKDYHRYHIPCDLIVKKAVHIPGKLYPVNMTYLNKQPNLFVENERVVLECENSDGKLFYMVLVGALNVGVMQVAFEPLIQTNASSTEVSVYKYEEGIQLSKNDDFGCFEMGSTIVIIAESEFLDLGVEPGKKVSYAQTIAKVK